MKQNTRPFVSLSLPVVTLLLTFLATTPAHAHHAMGGKPVTTAFEGFLSGIAHPLIGMDHLAMIVAIGVLAASMRPGFLLAALFVLAAMLGSSLHLLGMSLPWSEQLIALSVVAVGGILALRKSPHSGIVLGICAVAGVLHGYAYGESIFGAEPTPLAVYLVGFTLVQLFVAGIAYAAAKIIVQKSGEKTLVLRPAGFVIAGAGLALLGTQIVAMAFPLGQ